MAKANLAKLSVEDLQKEISRRQGKLPKLIAERDALNSQIAELEGLGGVKPTAVAHRKPGRRKAGRRAMKSARAGSLSSALTEVLNAKGKLPIAEAAEAVLAAGYKSKSKDFKNIVSMTLSKDKRFKRVGRGVYTLKATATTQKNVDTGKAAPGVVKPGRAGSLSSALVDALGAKGKFTVAEATDAVLATGYKSKSKAFPKIVRMTLLKGKQFKRVGRGVYALKG